MSVLACNRQLSKVEAVTYSLVVQDMLRDFMIRNFGVKDLEHVVQLRYAYGRIPYEDYSRYRFLLVEHKKSISELTVRLTNAARAANSLFPTSLHEYEVRRDFQNSAIVCCEQIIKELQVVCDTFDVDVNTYERYVKAVKREIALLRDWRQQGNAIKKRLEGSIC